MTGIRYVYVMKISDKDNIQKLLNLVEGSLHRKIKAHHDFEFLSSAVSTRNHEKISSSTLKRLWGYDSRQHQPYHNTLSILCRFLGYKDWDDFVSHEDGKSPTLFSYTAGALFSHELEVGDQLWISWKPNRMCNLFYKGNHQFIVLDAINSKLNPGDTFNCMLFSEGIPLYLDKFVRNNQDPITFVVGYSGGLTSIRLIKSKGKRHDSHPHIL